MNMIKVIFKFENKEPIYVSFNPTTKVQSLYQYVNDLFNLDHCHLFHNNIEINYKDSITLQSITKGNNIMLYVLKDLNNEIYMKTFPNQTIKYDNTTQGNNSITSDRFDKARAKNQADKLMPLLKKEHEELIQKYNKKKEQQSLQEKQYEKILEKSVKSVNEYKQKLKLAMEKMVNTDKELEDKITQLNSFITDAQKGKYYDDIAKIQVPLSPKSAKIIEYHNKLFQRKMERVLWKGIIVYLDFKELLNISTLNKCISKETFECLYQIESSRKKINDIHIAMRLQKYENYLKKTPFSLSSTSQTELNGLLNNEDNQNKLLRIFSSDNSELITKKNKMIVLYRILFQLTNEINSLSFENDEDFIQEIKEKINQEVSYHDILNEKIEMFDFSMGNIIKVGDLIRKYEIYTINYKSIMKECATTGYVAMIIQDVFSYIKIRKLDGLYEMTHEALLDDKNQKTKKINDKYHYFHKRLIQMNKMFVID